jgi:hypothetical protein
VGKYVETDAFGELTRSMDTFALPETPKKKRRSIGSAFPLVDLACD